MIIIRYIITNRSLGKQNPPSYGQTSEKVSWSVCFNMWHCGDQTLKMFVKVIIIIIAHNYTSNW